MANFKILSRYTGGQVSTTREGKDFLILRKPLKLNLDSDDVFIQISKELIQRPDLISSKAYETPDLWWVIYDYNNIKDPLFEITIGTLLRIPSLDRVLNAIKNLEN